MARTRSAKGEMVDFDLLKIRQTLTEKPVSVDVKAREDFIDKKLRRRLRKVKAAVPVVDVQSEALASVETSQANEIIDPPKETKPQVQDSKQKHRPPSK